MTNVVQGRADAFLHQAFVFKPCQSGYQPLMETVSPSSLCSNSSCYSQEPENKPSRQGAPSCHCRPVKWASLLRKSLLYVYTQNVPQRWPLAIAPPCPLPCPLCSLLTPTSPSHPISSCPVPSALLPCPSPEARSPSRTSGSRCAASRALGWVEQGSP